MTVGPRRRGRAGQAPMRSFAPHRLGRYECDAWVCYYRHEWAAFLRASYALVREGFGMPAHRTLQGAWLVLRANMLWAPYPDNDPAGAEATMRRFYALVESVHHLGLDPAQAARREIAWWRAHRELQHGEPPAGPDADASAGDSPGAADARAGGAQVALTDALTELYAYVYRAAADAVRPAAELRARAMVFSDRWVRAGCDLGDPLLVEELTCLVRSYAALLEAVRS